MGKTLDQLNLKDDPLPTPPAPVDPRTTEWYQFSQDIDDLLATGHYTWAEDTLTDIQRTVETYKTVTPAQRRAVTNIETARGRGRTGGYRRRYEGYR